MIPGASRKSILGPFSKEFCNMLGGKIVYFRGSSKNGSVDGTEAEGYTFSCPVKQKRATLGSDPLRDSRMRLRRIFRPGKSIDLPASFYFGISRVTSYALKNPGGLGAEPPEIVAYLRMGKLHFTLNQDTSVYLKYTRSE